MTAEVETLSVLKHIGTTIRHASRWYPVFERYLAGLADRVRAFGVDPSRVAPSRRGDGGKAAKPTRPPGIRPRFDPLDCLDVDRGKVKCVKVRKITVDICFENDDDCC